MSIKNRVKKAVLFALFITCLLVSMFYYGKQENPRYMMAGYISSFAFYMMATKQREDEQNAGIY